MNVLRSFIVLCSLLIFQSVYAQDHRISIHVSNVELEKVFFEIRSKTEVSFVYNHEELLKVPNVSISKDNISVEEILEIVLDGTGLTYSMVNNTIVIQPVKEEISEKKEEEDMLKQNIRGKVLDKDSKSPLPFATVQILHTDPLIGTSTDYDGQFILPDVPVGRYDLKISFVGYGDLLVSEILLGSAKEAIVHAELTEKIDSLGELVVATQKSEPVNDMAIVNARPFNSEETKRFAATVGDPGRMAQIYAGVSGTDDASNEISIRGNSPNWLLWRLEGVEIPSPNHFAEEGYSAGAISLLSANMLGSSDFYTGAFPAEYGNALSGVFDINLRNGNNRENEYVFQVGVLGVDLSAEGPFKKEYEGSYLFNYRYSTLSVLNNVGFEISENAFPNYQDLSFKINLPTKKIGNISIWGVGGLSDSDEKYVPDTLNGEKLKYGYRDYTKAGMYATGITHTFFVNDKSYVRSVFSSSSSYSSNDYSQMDSLGILKQTFFDDLENRAFRVNSFYNRKISNRLTMRTGIGLNFLSFRYYTRSYREDTDDFNAYLDKEGTTRIYQGYTQIKYKITDRLVFSGGLHYIHFTLNQDNSLEPRAGVAYELPHAQKIGLGYGKHTRHEQLPVYFVENKMPDGTGHMPNKSLQLTRSHHFMVSYEKSISDDWYFRSEVYFQHIPNLPVANNPDKYWSSIFGAFYPDDTLANIGEGRNYGIELTVQKYFSKSYYFLVTSSLFDAQYRAADSKWRNTRYNVRYVNNFVGGREFKWGDNKMLSLNGKILWSGGKRLIPIDLEASIAEGEAVFDMEEIYETQAKDYFRFDVGVRLHFFKVKSEHVLSLDIQNVTNRLNTWLQTYDAENQTIVDYPMAGLIPILSYRIEF